MEEKNSAQQVKTIDIMKVIRKFWFVVLVTALLCSAFFTIYTIKFIPETYSSTVKFYVLSERTGSGGGNSSTARLLAEEYKALLKNIGQLSEQLAEESGVSNPSAIGSMISVSSVGDSSLLLVHVTHTDPELAYRVAVAIEKFAPDTLIEFTEAGDIKIADSPVLDTVPNSPNVKKNTVLGFLVGFVLSFGAAIVFEMFDNRILTEHDLKDIGLPVLGSIPTFHDGFSKSKKGEYGSGGKASVKKEEKA